MAKKEIAAAPKQGVNKWEEQLAALAQDAAAVEQTSANVISFRNGKMTFKGVDVPGNKMNVVIIASVHENAFYPGRFDAANPQPPVCYAFSEDGKDMAPHEDSSEAQSSACQGCPNDVWGSANTGRGKACKNIRRLQLITEDDLEDVVGAETAVAKIPVTSVKAWGNYVNQCATVMKRPPFALVTEISCVEDQDDQFHINFKCVGQITDDDTLQQLLERHGKAVAELMTPYPAPQAPAPQKALKGAAGVGKAGRR